LSTFNLLRVSTRVESVIDEGGLHWCGMIYHTEDASEGAAYKNAKVTSFKENLRLEDTSMLTNIKEFDDKADFQIQSIFPQLVVQQILNSLVARQLLPKGPGEFELIFNFLGYADDTPEMRLQRIKEANLVGPAGFISMEDTLATELVQFGIAGSGNALSVADMGRDASETENFRCITSEDPVRRFWRGYQELMGL
jgi:anthranilate 1,2-dioxygenase large subunit